MENTTYSSLVSSFFNKIKDNMFVELDEGIAYDIVVGYISPACNQFQSCTQDLSNRDDNLEEFGFCLSQSNQDILVNYMVIEYLDSNYLRTQTALKSRLTSKDYHSLNLHNQLSKVMELRNHLKEENDQLAINKSYIKSSLFNIVTNRKR